MVDLKQNSSCWYQAVVGTQRYILFRFKTKTKVKESRLRLQLLSASSKISLEPKNGIYPCRECSS